MSWLIVLKVLPIYCHMSQENLKKNPSLLIEFFQLCNIYTCADMVAERIIY